MQNQLKKKLAKLPTSPGVYFFKNSSGEIIYIGKASILKRRVTSYFTKTHDDYKTPLLVRNIADMSWIETSSEIEALFLEAELIKRHKPLYNVQEKDDKNFIFVKVAIQEDFPYVQIARRPDDDKARYFGPFIAGYQVRQALRYIRRIFPYYTKQNQSHASKIEYQIGVIPNPEMSKTEYRRSIQRLMMMFEGKTATLLKDLEKEMKKYARSQDYEKAAIARNQYLAMKALNTKIVFGSEESHDLSLDIALKDLSDTLGLPAAPHRIECYDISNFAGGDAVSSMIVFTDGVPNQREYRHFKMRTRGPNDFAMMQETLTRRFSERNAKWPRPDLIIIDGGKGQLGVARGVLAAQNLTVPVVGLAKRYETVVQHEDDSSISQKRDGIQKSQEYWMINFPENSPTLHLLQRIRDEAHRFAVTYHTLVRKKRTQASWLEEIDGIGPSTRKKLIRHFGSSASVKLASLEELRQAVGKSKASLVFAATTKAT